jgi:hypothetical protein
MKQKLMSWLSGLSILICCSVTVMAQAGSEINPSMHIVTNMSGITVADAKITYDAARQFVQQEFGNLADDPSFYCMIHVMRWKNFGPQPAANTSAPGNVQPPGIDLQNWYTYNVNEKDRFEGVRIFGSRNVGFLYVHVNVRGNDGSTLTQPERGLLGSPTAVTDRGHTPIPLDNGFVVQEFQRFNYTWEEKEKLPKLASDLSQLLGFIAEGAGVLPEAVIALYGSSQKPLPLKYRTSDITVKMIQLIDEGMGNIEKNQISAQTYDNEGRTRFDISLGVPVTKVKELKFDASDNTVRSKNTDKQHVYAFMNIFVKPVDTKGVTVNSFPHFMVGVPITGKPLDSPFVGMGYGFNKIQVFTGVVINREKRPSTLMTGDTATQNQLESDFKYVYKPRFMVGLNFPLKQIIDALSSKK